MGKAPLRLLKFGFPILCFSLGTWQVYRLGWKRDLLAKLEATLHAPPINVTTVDEIVANPYQRMNIRGSISADSQQQFVLIGPRSGKLINANYAYIAVVPFTLSNGSRILLNLGWVSRGQEQLALEEMSTAQASKSAIAAAGPDAFGCYPGCYQVMLDHTEEKAWFLSRNDPVKSRWVQKNVCELAAYLEAEPVMVRRIIIDGPDKAASQQQAIKPVPPSIDISNRHLEYIITWFGIGIGTLLMGLSLA